jgi:putative oxidoreductase
MRFLLPHTDRIYALLRIVAGFMFTLHGMQKLFGLFGGVPPGAPPFIVYGAGLIELVCGVLIAIGLFGSPAAFLASGTMAFAFFLGHVIPAKGNILPIVNQGELAALYCFVFFYISAHGSGIWSVDAARGAQRAAPRTTA